MKASRYNYSLALPDGNLLYFNFYTLKLVVVEATDVKLAQETLKNPGKPRKDRRSVYFRKTFLENGFLVEDLIDEIELLRSAHQAQQNDTRQLSLAILPTLDCNFRCVYCFERRRSDVMEKEVQDALIRFVESKLGRGGRLNVTWYGGEPLLRPDVIERLSKEFLKISKGREAIYSSMIVTNGYLLDRKAIDRLVRLGVTDAQVTLDGPPQVHDRRRPFRDGGKTFKKIIGHVKMAAKKMKVSIRMNVDDQNGEFVDELLDILVREGLNDKTGFHVGQTNPATSACQDFATWCLEDREFHRLELTASLKAADLGFETASAVSSKNNYCGACLANSFLVSPSGAIGKCWFIMPDDGHATEHLLFPITQEMEENRRRWSGDSPFERECLDCLYLPICMGGCPCLYQNHKKVHCVGWKHYPEENLLFYYLLKKREQEMEAAREFQTIVKALKSRKRARERKEVVPPADKSRSN